MYKDFFVCFEDELKELLERESKNHSLNPKIYYGGFTRYSAWVDEDYVPECDLTNPIYYCVDFSDDGENEVFEKFFDCMAMKALEKRNYLEIAIGGDSEYIDVFFDETEYYSLYDFWHSNELSLEDIECLNGLAD